MKTKLLSAFVLLFMCITANAYDLEVDGVCYYVDLSDQTAIVANPSSNDVKTYYEGTVTVPASFTYKGRAFTVVGVADNAFYFSKSLISVSLPNTIKELPSNLFLNCYSLSNVDLPDSITKIPSNCFANCVSLENVSIPDSVTVFGNSSFSGCTAFGPEYTVRKNVTILDQFSFSYCLKLKRFIIEDSENSLLCGNGFLSYDVLDYMYVGRPFDCINGADTIKVLELGAGLKTNAFPRDNNFKTIISDIEDPTLFDPGFTNDTYLNVPLYVPVGKVDAYRQAEGWKNFFDIRENKDVNKIDNVAAAKKAGATMYYNLSGQAVAKDYKGVVIERYSDGTSKKVLNK